MHSASQAQVLWTSIIASAVVAGIATTLIEYLAKPRLEARKERILEAHRKRRSAVQGLRRASQILNRVSIYADPEYVTDPLTQERIRNSAFEAAELVISAEEILGAPPSAPGLAYSVGYTDGFLALIRIDPSKGDWDRAGFIFNGFRYYAEFFSTPRWRWRQRSRMLRNLTEHEKAARDSAKRSDNAETEATEPHVNQESEEASQIQQ